MIFWRASILAQLYKEVGGRRSRGVGVMGVGGGKTIPGEDTRSQVSHTDGPDHATRPKEHHSGQGGK